MIATSTVVEFGGMISGDPGQRRKEVVKRKKVVERKEVVKKEKEENKLIKCHSIS